MPFIAKCATSKHALEVTLPLAGNAPEPSHVRRLFFTRCWDGCRMESTGRPRCQRLPFRLILNSPFPVSFLLVLGTRACRHGHSLCGTGTPFRCAGQAAD